MKIGFNPVTAQIRPYQGTEKQNVKNFDTLTFGCFDESMKILSEANKAYFLGNQEQPKKDLDEFTQKLFDNYDIGFFATPNKYNSIRQVDSAKLNVFYESLQKLTNSLVRYFSPVTSEFLDALDEFYSNGSNIIDSENIEYYISNNNSFYTLRTEKNKKQAFLILEKDFSESKNVCDFAYAKFEHNLAQSPMVGSSFEVHIPGDGFSSHIKEAIAEYPITFSKDRYDTKSPENPWRILLIDNYGQRHMIGINTENKIPRFEFYHCG